MDYKQNTPLIVCGIAAMILVAACTGLLAFEYWDLL